MVDLIRPDARTDAAGNVYLAMSIAEFEAFCGLLNQGNMWVREMAEGHDYEGPRTLLRFMPRYMLDGHGRAALDIQTLALDDCRDGWVCSRHPFDPPAHGDCHEERMPCPDGRHERTAESPPED